jgi:HEAT repeat protein
MTSENQNNINAELASGEKEQVKAALSALNEMLRAMAADSSSIGPLSCLLDEEDLEIRRAASWSIAKLAQNKAIRSAPLDKLIILLADPDEEVRENAAWSIGELAGVGVGSMGAIEGLNTALEDSNVQVRGMVAWALGRLAEKMNIALPSSITKLQKLLSDKSLFVRKGAEFSLERVNRIIL